MNPTIRIQHATGAYTTFEFDERIVARELGPRKLLDFMMAFYRAHTFTELTSLELLPLPENLAKVWQNERQVPWFEGIMQPTVGWRFEERMQAATKTEGPPMAIVHGNVVLSIFARVASEFFENASVITGVHRS